MHQSKMPEVVLGTWKQKLKSTLGDLCLLSSFSKLCTFGGQKNLIRLWETHRERTVGIPSPICPVGILHLVKGRSCNLAHWKSCERVYMVHEEWDWRKGKQQHSQYSFHWFHTLSFSHRNLPQHTESVTFSEWPEHLPWHLFHRTSPARSLLLAHDQNPTWDSKRWS